MTAPQAPDQRGKPKPIAGFPSRIAAVRHYVAEGLTNAQIAERLGLPIKAVADLRAELKRRPLTRQVPISRDALHSLAPHADRRGISTNELARRLLTTAAAEDMIDAILDDTPGRDE